MKRSPLINLLLIVALVLTSQSMAVARGASAASGQMVLCTGAGPVAIYIDSNGNPTSAPHICPDSALNILADVALPEPGFHFLAGWPTLAPPVSPFFRVAAFLPSPPSRAPPLLV